MKIQPSIYLAQVMTKRFLTTSLVAHASASSLLSSFISVPSPDRCKNQMHSPSVIRPSITRQIQKLHLTYNTAKDISILSLSQLLELLHQNKIRYPPSASREELEDLLQVYLHNSINKKTPDGSSRSKPKNERVSSGGKNAAVDDEVNGIVDAEVLPEQTYYENEMYTGRRTYQYANENGNKKQRRRNKSYNNSYHRPEARGSRNRQNKQSHYSNDNVIDAVFDLPDLPSKDATYENGLQIFLMGFFEAGKTVAELAVDSAKKTVSSPFSDDVWYDGVERGYATRPKRRTRRSRRELHSNRSGMDQRKVSTLTQSPRQVSSYYDSTPTKSTQVQQRLATRSRDSTNDAGQPKPIYGLEYVHDANSSENEDMIPRQYRQLGHHKQQWKDRLRKKFDAALGVEPTSAPIEKESYYDSWKRNMRDMDDKQKDRLRRKMATEMNTLSDVPNNKQTRMTATRIPQNRRARMNAAKAVSLNESALPDSIRTASAHKTRTKSHRLDERPFWKERGSIASLLFDNNSSSWKTGIQKKNKRTLEVSQAVHLAFWLININDALFYFSNFSYHLPDEKEQLHL
jgi:hypothetical protein